VTSFLIWAVVGLAAVLSTLVVAIVLRRVVADRHRKRDASLRPAIEATVAGYLAGDDLEPPRLPASPAARRLVRAVALDALSELRGAERLRLVTLLEHAGIVADAAAELRSRRARVRRDAAESLGQMRSAQAAESLLTGLHDPDLDVRVSCASGLAELGDQQFVPPVVAVADEAAVDRPGAAAAILVTLGRRIPSALALPLDPTAELSGELRRLAIAVAGELRLAEHAPALRLALDSADPERVARAARGLGMIGDMDATVRLLGLVDDHQRPWFVRLAASEALGELGNPQAAGPLERELLSGTWLEQSAAARALRRLGGAGEDALRRALGSPVETVRAHARVALEQ
jgi:HEAT repeat protein